jgi:hypothetical protein
VLLVERVVVGAVADVGLDRIALDARYGTG